VEATVSVIQKCVKSLSSRPMNLRQLSFGKTPCVTKQLT